MLDRSKYSSPHAPTADQLVKRWTENKPSGAEIESFFLHELCETAAHDYFLAVSDVFYDAIATQPQDEQFYSLYIIGFRLLEAASKANIADAELAKHFYCSLQKFANLFYVTADLEDPSSTNGTPLSEDLVLRFMQR